MIEKRIIEKRSSIRGNGKERRSAEARERKKESEMQEEGIRPEWIEE